MSTFLEIPISNKISRYLDLARRQAYQSTYDKWRHGAVLVRGGAIINASYNDKEFCSFSKRFCEKKENRFSSRHAEIKTILGISRSLTYGSTLYVVRINIKGEFRLSKPCSMCYGVMKFCGIKKIVYTMDDNKIGILKL